MNRASESREQLEQWIAALKARIADCQARFPAHSIPPAMLAELDELDEQLAEAQRRLQLLNEAPE